MNEFKIAVVNEPSVFEPMKFQCILMFTVYHRRHVAARSNNFNFKADPRLLSVQDVTDSH